MDHHGKTMYIIRSWWHEAKFSSISPQAQRSPAILTSFFPAGAVDWFPFSTNPHIHIISVGYNLHFGWSNPTFCCLCHTISDGKIKMFGAKIITFHRKTLILMAKTTTFGCLKMLNLYILLGSKHFSGPFFAAFFHRASAGGAPVLLGPGGAIGGFFFSIALW